MNNVNDAIRLKWLKEITEAGFQPKDAVRLEELYQLLPKVNSFDLLDAALKQPQLFYQKPETLARHGVLMKRLMRATHTDKPWEEFVKKNPVGLVRSDGALIGRIVAAAVVGDRRSIGSLLVTPNSKLQAGIIDHYQGRLATADTPERRMGVTRTLQQLHRLKVIDGLPDGVEPMPSRAR